MTTNSEFALIIGISGQDGAYLAELPLNKRYEVHGLKRRSSLFNTDAVDHLYQEPTTPFSELVREIVKSDYSAAKRDSLVRLSRF